MMILFFLLFYHIVVYALADSAKLSQPTGQRQKNFKILNLKSSNTNETLGYTLLHCGLKIGEIPIIHTCSLLDSFFFKNTIAITDPKIFIAPTEIAVKLAARLSTMIPLKMFTAY